MVLFLSPLGLWAASRIYAAKPCPIVDVELPKKILAGYAMLLRERERKKRSGVRPMRWSGCINGLRSSGPERRPVFVGINVRLLFPILWLFLWE